LRYYGLAVDAGCSSLVEITLLVPEHGMRGDVVKGKRRDDPAMFRGQIGVLLPKPVGNLSSTC
jgi:hypothetical protein